MQNAKPITIWLLIIASLSGLSYGTIYAYKYVTTTTIEDVSKKVEAYEKAKSDLQKVRINYCNDTSTGKVDYDKCWETLEKLTWTASLTPISEVPSQTIEEAKKKFAHAKLYQDVCKKQINSPLCKDRELFDRLYQLTEERLPWKNFYPILIGMTNAESSLGLDYAKDNVWWTCNGRNNWGGAKYIIKDDNSRDYSRSLNWFLYWEEYSWRFVDQYWCNLFPFKSIEEYWISKVNWIRYWYAWCVDHERPIWCISGKYVWNAKVHEQSWIDNVSVFLN